MLDLFERRKEGEGKFVNKKMLQDFIKEVLFAKDMGELSELKDSDCTNWPGAAAVILQTVINANKEGDFSKMKPLLDFAFEKDLRPRK
jgi:hypothetical protein